MLRAGTFLFLAIMLMVARPAAATNARTILSFSDLAGWERDDHAAALEAFLRSCPALKEAQWRAVCALAETHPEPRAFFELFFRPVLIEDGKPALFTGYYEPELLGSRTRTARFRYPLYRKPPELVQGRKWFSRAEIEEQGLLEGRGLEIAWVEDPTALFFLQIQGSGTIRLTDGTKLRVGYGGSNGHNYRSIGKELVRQGIFNAHQVSARVIGNWVRRNPKAGEALLRTSPSYVFFRVIGEADATEGPRGALNLPLTPMRSLAVDPKYIPLGAPVWLEKGGSNAFRHLMIAQDTGSAIKGAQRADIFTGTGNEAGKIAARIRDPGRMIVLLPIDMAYSMAEEAIVPVASE